MLLRFSGMAFRGRELREQIHAMPAGLVRRVLAVGNHGDVALFGAAKLSGIAGIRTVQALAKIPVVRFAGNLLLFFAAEQSAVAVAHPFQAIPELVVVIGLFYLLFLVFGEL